MIPLIDTNIVLDLIQSRERAEKVKSTLKQYAGASITANTFATVFYLLRKELKQEEIYEYLSTFEILDVTDIDCKEGYLVAQNSDDVEDCIELAVANRNKRLFVTGDVKLYNRYSKINYTKIHLIR